MLMDNKGYLVENDISIPNSYIGIYDGLNVDYLEGIKRLEALKVSLIFFCSSVKDLREEFMSILKSLNIQVCENGDITIFVTNDYLHENIAEFNQQALKYQNPSMLVKPSGLVLFLFQEKLVVGNA